MAYLGSIICRDIWFDYVDGTARLRIIPASQAVTESFIGVINTGDTTIAFRFEKVGTFKGVPYFEAVATGHVTEPKFELYHRLASLATNDIVPEKPSTSPLSPLYQCGGRP